MAVTVITGATGFVGRHLLWDILRKAAPGDRIVAIIRAGSADEAGGRLRDVLADPSAAVTRAQTARAEALCGDIRADRLGLSEAEDAALWPAVTHVVHCAASVQFTLDLATSRAINVEGTRRVLQGSARARQLQRVDYIGTAFVSGCQRGLVREDAALTAGRFNNSYERSKAEAEALVLEAACDLPVTIFRPSIVVGDSVTGLTQSFKVLYWPLRMLARRLVVCIPADRAGQVDIVPIDYVRDAISFIRASQPPGGQIYHIACGPEHASTVEDLTRIAATKLGVWQPPFISPRYVYPVLRPILIAVLFGDTRKVILTGEQYLPYLAHHARFDTTNTQAALAGSGIEPVPPVTYFGRLIDYCIASDWGNRVAPKGDAV